MGSHLLVLVPSDSVHPNCTTVQDLESGELPALAKCRKGHSSWSLFFRTTNKHVAFLLCNVCQDTFKLTVVNVQ